MTDVAETFAVEGRLRDYGAITQEAMEAHLPDGEPRVHLWDLVGDYPRRPGKAIRPALCLATCVAFGGDMAEALPTAVAIELLHNAFLVHDDIEDGSELRRGTPTLHRSHGVPLAVNAGDALVLLAGQPLRDNRTQLGSRLAGAVADEFELMARRTVEGQAVELGWRRDPPLDLTPDDYLDLIMRKTCWYTTIHPMRAGALIGSWGRADLDTLVRFGFYLGAAFQIRDDVLNLVGDEATYGKEQLGDLYEGKRTLMLNHVLSVSRGEDRDMLLRYLHEGRANRTPESVAEVLHAMEDHGSIEFAESFARGIAAAAYSAFEEAFDGVAASDDRRFVEALIPWMVDRTA